jgi:hypothetical protein
MSPPFWKLWGQPLKTFLPFLLRKAKNLNDIFGIDSWEGGKTQKEGQGSAAERNLMVYTSKATTL